MRRGELALTLSFLFLAVTIPLAHSENVTVSSGDQLVMTMGNDGLVHCVDTILAIANDSVNGTYSGQYYVDGNIVGNISATCSPEIGQNEVLYRNLATGSAEIQINYNVSLEPFKFSSFVLTYDLNGTLRNVGGSWNFKETFSLTGPWSMELSVKIPKPTYPWDKIVVTNTVPTPQVFLDESDYYVMTWKNPMFVSGNTQMFYVELNYKTVSDVTYWIVLFVASVFSLVLGAGVGYVAKKYYDKRSASELKPGDESHKQTLDSSKC